MAGCVRLVGTEVERIVAESNCLLESETARREMTRNVNPYGDGKAAERIVEALLK
ncbi:UDP-N-acetylglucosamine 2-epimerase [compost metagenome]